MKELIVVWWAVIGQEAPHVSYIDPEDRPCQEVLDELWASRGNDGHRIYDLLDKDKDGEFLYKMECQFVEML